MIDINKLKESGNYRYLKHSNVIDKYIVYKDKKCLNLGGNDYLGIATNEKLKNEFLDSIKDKNFFFGSGASRLVYSSHEVFEELERDFESIFSDKKALIFNSGYGANLGVISVLSDENTLFLADKLIHASMIDALKISKANYKRYKHFDLDELEILLEKNHKNFKKIIILTEAVFSMDGDVCNILKIIELKNRYENVQIYLDEAHSFFSLNHYGLAKKLKVDENIDFILITFSKALGGCGAVILCKNEIKEILINQSRSLIYSTAIPSINVAWTKFILNKDFSNLRKNLLKNVEFLGSDTQICPFVLGDSQLTSDLSEKLRDFGYFIPAIKPPTVPVNTARLRISLRADIDTNELIKLKDLLHEVRNH